MPTVSVIINGRAYRLACGAGEEARLRDLADDLNRRIDHLATGAALPGDDRLIVMAALLVTDELLELKGRLAESEPVTGIADRTAEPPREARAS